MPRSIEKRSALLVLVLLATGCAARAEPLEAEGRVVAAGAPVRVGSACSLRLWPAWRQGVNCQLLLACGGVDLFGGKRIGGYAVCETRDRHFLRALDERAVVDGDPALDLDLVRRRIDWRDGGEGESLAIALLSVRETPATR
jgi:hypothetical protein